MRPPDLDAIWMALGEADPDVMDRDQLVEVQRRLATVQAWCDSLQVRTTRRLRGLAAEGRAEAPAELLSKGRHSSKDARAADERERVASALPGFEDALSSGAVSSGHLDAIAQATRNLDEAARAEFVAHGEALLADAQHDRVDVFERRCRDLARDVIASRPGTSPEDELAAQRARANVKHWTDRDIAEQWVVWCHAPAVPEVGKGIVLASGCGWCLRPHDPPIPNRVRRGRFGAPRDRWRSLRELRLSGVGKRGDRRVDRGPVG